MIYQKGLLLDYLIYDLQRYMWIHYTIKSAALSITVSIKSAMTVDVDIF